MHADPKSFASTARPPLLPAAWNVAGQPVPLVVRRNPAAKRYTLRMDPSSLRLTLPPYGTHQEALAFLVRCKPWLERRLDALKSLPNPVWTAGSTILLRGVPTQLQISGSHLVLGEFRMPLPRDGADLRSHVERHLRAQAEVEIVRRTRQLAEQHRCRISRITVRAQRTRWGSCSTRRVISLNWRLLQTPNWVRDYIILHELMHLRHMNHSEAFWAQVAAVCPEWDQAEAWLRKHSRTLLS